MPTNDHPDLSVNSAEATPHSAPQPATPRAQVNPLTNIALVASFAAFIAVTAILPAITIGPVPITLQTFAVMLTGAVLGANRGFLAVLLYIVIGLIGLPVFAGGVAGFAVFARPSIGYLLAFPFAAWLIGVIVARIRRSHIATNVALIFLATIAGNVVFIWPLGILGMWWRVPFDTFGEAFMVNLAFIPGDLIKGLVAAIVATFVHRAFPNLLARRQVRDSIET